MRYTGNKTERQSPASPSFWEETVIGNCTKKQSNGQGNGLGPTRHCVSVWWSREASLREEPPHWILNFEKELEIWRLGLEFQSEGKGSANCWCGIQLDSLMRKKISTECGKCWKARARCERSQTMRPLLCYNMTFRIYASAVGSDTRALRRGVIEWDFNFQKSVQLPCGKWVNKDPWEYLKCVGSGPDWCDGHKKVRCHWT